RRSAPQPQAPAENFIVIVLDDVGTDKLSIYDGNTAPPYAATPRLNQLASQGIRFTSFYVNPFCSTTRACLQTGRYAYHTGIGGITLTTQDPGGLNTPGAGVNDSEVFLSEFLATAPRPYASGAFGKWHLTVDYVGSGPGEYFQANGKEDHAIVNGYSRFRG